MGADLIDEPRNAAGCGSGGVESDWTAAAERLALVIAPNAQRWLVRAQGEEARVGSRGGTIAGALSRPIRPVVPDELVSSPQSYGPQATAHMVG